MWEEIATWFRALEEQGALAPRTVALYGQDVRRFASWLMTRDVTYSADPLGATEAASGRRPRVTVVSVQDVTDVDAQAYRAHLLSLGLGRSAINRALSGLRLFFARSGRAGDNPFADVPTIPRQPPVIPRRRGFPSGSPLPRSHSNQAVLSRWRLVTASVTPGQTASVPARCLTPSSVYDTFS